MDINIKTKFKDLFDEYIVNRKAMFIPIVAVASFMFVGYAATDKEKTDIKSNQIEVPYGEKLDLNSINITDNKDSRDLIRVDADTDTLNVNQLGTYDVEVTAIDQGSNEARKTIEVVVVDNKEPEFEMLGTNGGYTVEVPVKGSTDFSSYIKASDNVDGDVTPFIEASASLNTDVPSFQDITLTVSDSSGNEKSETFTFAVSDLEAPVINFLQGETVTVDYGSTFDINNYIKVVDNLDGEMMPSVEGSIDTLKLDEVQPLKLSVKDSSGNIVEGTLNVVVKDLSAPVITLKESSITISAGDSVDFSSYIVSAIDNKDGDVRAKVSIDAPDTSKAGNKTATYTVIDEAGNRASASLSVKINKVYSVEAGSNPYANTILSAAYSKLGTPYKWGAEGPNAFDCSGFVKWCYAKAGISLPHSSSGQKNAGTQISVSAAQPGDILWKSGHVGIYIGGGKYIHAPNTGDVVKISSVSGSGFVCAVRVK